MQAVALHPDVLLVTSALLQVNCVLVRGGLAGSGAIEELPGGREEMVAETFLIDSPVLPDELDALPALLEQAQFPAPRGLLTTHADWDHMLARLVFPNLTLGCAESSAERLAAEPGVAQRELRAFDEGLMIERARPLALGSVQALPVPGRCEIGGRELELHRADGHSTDGMAVYIRWARVLVTGDYLSPAEIPTFDGQGGIDAYLATLGRLRDLLKEAEHIVPGHGSALSSARALALLEEDVGYLLALRSHGIAAELPHGRRGAANRQRHVENATSLETR